MVPDAAGVQSAGWGCRLTTRPNSPDDDTDQSQHDAQHEDERNDLFPTARHSHTRNLLTARTEGNTRPGSAAAVSLSRTLSLANTSAALTEHTMPAWTKTIPTTASKRGSAAPP